MDASKIFIIVMSIAFFGFIAYLAVMNQRNIRADALREKAQPNIETAKPGEQKPRNVA